MFLSFKFAEFTSVLCVFLAVPYVFTISKSV